MRRTRKLRKTRRRRKGGSSTLSPNMVKLVERMNSAGCNVDANKIPPTLKVFECYGIIGRKYHDAATRLSEKTGLRLVDIYKAIRDLNNPYPQGLNGEDLTQEFDHARSIRMDSNNFSILMKAAGIDP